MMRFALPGTINRNTPNLWETPARIVTVLCAILAAIALWFSPAASAEPAIYSGNFTCESKYPGTKSDIGTGQCWSCPSSHPNRTVFGVNSNQACEKRAGINWSTATDRGRGTGLLRTDCPKGAFWDPNGRCYSCPGGYNRSLEYGVTSARACYKRYGATRRSASIKGNQGCAADAFRNGLSDNCFKCPAGTYRNANIGSDLSKINACTRCGTEGAKPCPVTTLRKSCDKFLAEDFAKGICVKTQAGYVNEAALKELRRYAPGLLDRAATALSFSQDEQLVESLRNGRANIVNRSANRAINPCVFEEFKTWTLGGTGETSLILGGGLETGIAIDISPQGRSGNQRPAFWYGDASYSLGLSAGSSAGINYGCWTDANNAILGASHGITMSLSDMAGPLPEIKSTTTISQMRALSPGVDLVIGIWFGYDENIKEDSVLDIFPIKTGVGKFQGITLTPVYGQGVGIGPQYVRGYTAQFPGKQPDTATANTRLETAKMGKQRIVGEYRIAGTSSINEFRMYNDYNLEVRRKNAGQEWMTLDRTDDRTFTARNGATYRANPDGTLTWKSNDNRNIETQLIFIEAANKVIEGRYTYQIEPGKDLVLDFRAVDRHIQEVLPVGADTWVELERFSTEGFLLGPSGWIEIKENGNLKWRTGGRGFNYIEIKKQR